MGWTILALVMTVLMGGIIAYNGDVIGRKYGKRRASVFGLRPKHTAILITSVTGVVISAITTGVLFMLVRPVREIILDGEDAIRLIPKLRAQEAGLTRSVNGLGAQNQQIAAQNRQLAAQNGMLHSRYGAAKIHLAQKQEEVGRLEEQSRIALERLQAARDRLVRAEEQTRRITAQNHGLAAKNQILAEMNHDLAQANTELNQAKVALTTQKAELTKQNTLLTEDNRKKESENRDYDRQNQVIAQQNDTLTRESAKLWKVNRDFLDANAELDQKNRELTASNKRLADENRDLERRSGISLANLAHMFEAMRTKRVVIHGGEDLARRIVPAGASPDVVRKTLEDLMHDANLAALQKGAAAGDNSSSRAVQIVDKRFYTPTPFGTVVPTEVTESDRVSAMVNRLAWSDAPVCVLALAVANSVESEPAAVDFQPFTDRLVYPRGRAVATRRVDAAQPLEKVFGDMVEFLKALGQSAIEHGMIPRIDPSTGTPQVGSLDWPELVRLVERVRAVGRPVKLTAVAANDTNAADPLKLDFKVEPSL